jgi:HPt (histidine-containing phosphotransfer) domain-containing protein
MNNKKIDGEEIDIMLLEFCVDFLTKRTQELNEFENYINNKQYNEIKSVLHKWFGFCKPYGFEKLHSIANNMEKSIALNDTARLVELVKEARKYLSIKQEQVFRMKRNGN